jgi:Streptomyces sporulation and cell division protein, SsgA.
MSNDRENRPIATELSARLLQQGSSSVAARIHLQYRSTEPYAVEMTIRVRDQKPITWMLGRELLDDGLRQQSGVGDVTITPCPQAPTALLHVTLRDDIGGADLEMRSEPVAEFLRLTHLHVPPGTEGLFVLIEDDVSALVS